MLGSLLGCTAHFVHDRFLGYHVYHDKADCTVIGADTGQSGEQIAFSVVVNDVVAFTWTIFVLVCKVEDTMDIGTAVGDLLDDKVFRLNAVYPLWSILNGITLHFAGSCIEQDDTGCFWKGKSTGVLIGGNCPVWLAVVIQLEGIVGDTGHQTWTKTNLSGNIKQQVAVRMVFDLVALHIADIVGVGCGYHDVTRCTVHIGQPFEEAGMIQRNDPDQFAVYHLDGSGVQCDL